MYALTVYFSAFMSENSGLEPLYFGKEILTFESLPSTNFYLRELAARSPQPEGLVVRAEYQTSGRGQMGNAWHSAPRQNLLFSLLLKPNWLKTSQVFYLNMSVCLALLDALNSFRPGFLIKWPNDVLFDEKKVAGILLENTLSRKGVSESVVGIGLNVNEKDFPEYLPRPISLSQVTGQNVPIPHLLRIVLEKLQNRYFQLQKNLDKTKHDFIKNLYGFQNHQIGGILVEIKGEKATAVLKDVLPDGHLMAEIDGEERVFNFKEIDLLP